MGFGADIKSVKEIKIGDLLTECNTDDLIKFGLIPEFVGRLPIISVLQELDRGALKRILVEPKNALVKQFQKIFSFEDVELVFTDDAVDAIANIAQAKESGARGLRSVLEKLLMDLMYDIPTKDTVAKIVINGGFINRTDEALITYKVEEEKSA